MNTWQKRIRRMSSLYGLTTGMSFGRARREIRRIIRDTAREARR